MLHLYVYSSWIFYFFLVSTRCWFHFLWWCVVRRKSLPEKVEVISSVCCTSQPWMHLRFAYTSAVNTSSWRRSWLLSVSLAQRLSDAWNGRRRRTKTSRRVSGCTFSHRTMSPATFAAFVQQHCDTDFLTITIFFNPQNPKSSKLCVCTTFSSICGSLPSLSLPLFLHFDILCFSDTLPISLSLHAIPSSARLPYHPLCSRS